MPSYTAQEKTGLSFILQGFLDADEPEAMIAVLRHVAERKAMGVMRGVITMNESKRWMALADALRTVEATVRPAA
jgi:hypothetical protein